MLKHNPARLTPLLLGLLFLAPFLPILIAPGGRVLGHPGADNPSMFFYYNEFAGRCWRQGTLPLWNPYIMLGQAFLGEGQAALFHPLSWLFAVLPAGVALNWINALCFLMGGLFFYGWLRALGLARGSSLCGALAWGFSNVSVSRIYAGHLTNMLVFFELPLMLMLWERWRATGRTAFLAGLGLAYAGMILAAHPQFLYIFSLFFMLYILATAGFAHFENRTTASRPNEWKGIGWLAVFVLLGIGIGAVQLLPTADLASQSFRTQASYEFATSSSFVPENLVTWLAPRFFGFSREAGPHQYWGRNAAWEMWAYLGILPLLLVPAGLAAAPRRRAWPLLICAVAFFILALGKFTLIYPLVYRFIPFFNMFRGPAKNMMIVELCLAAFAAHGFERLLHPPGGVPDRRALVMTFGAGAAGLLVLIVLYIYFIPGHAAAGSHWHRLIAYVRQTMGGDMLPPEMVEATARQAGGELMRAGLFIVLALGIPALAWSGRRAPALLPLCTILILADLLSAFAPLLFKTYPVSITSLPPEIVAPLQGGAWPQRVLESQFGPDRVNIAMRHGFSTPSGYAGNALARYNNFVNAIQGMPLNTPQVDDPINQYSPALRFFSFGALLLQPEEVAPGMKVIARTPKLALVEAPDPFPRAFIAAEPQQMKTPEQALEYVKSDADLLRRPAVEGPAHEAAPLAGEWARIVSFGINRVELAAKVARPRVLVLCEMFEKNWTATVDSQPAEVFPVNYLFRGVSVRPGDGESRIVFEYRPRAFYRGAAVSLASLAGLLGLGFATRRKRYAFADSAEIPPEGGTPQSKATPKTNRKRRAR